MSPRLFVLTRDDGNEYSARLSPSAISGDRVILDVFRTNGPDGYGSSMGKFPYEGPTAETDAVAELTKQGYVELDHNLNGK